MMPEPTDSAAGGAMPANGKQTRRTTSRADASDARLVALLGRWRAAERESYRRCEAADSPNPPEHLKRASDKALRASARLRGRVIDTAARTAPAILAKLCAVGAAIGAEALEDDLKENQNQYDDVLFSVVLDACRLD